MKAQIVFALIGASQGVDFCQDNYDCGFEDYRDGCCATWEIVSVMEDTAEIPLVWGEFSDVWGGDAKMTAGNKYSACATKRYLDAHADDVEEAGTETISNYVDLTTQLEIYPKNADDLGFSDDPTVDGWIAAWDGDKVSQQNFLIKVNCVDKVFRAQAIKEGAARVGSSLVALVTALSLL